VTRVLVAEDEQRIGSFLERGLRAAGFTATVCREGAVALALARDDDFELMILDLGLPDRDGLSVLRELRARGVRLPVLVLTGRSQTQDTVTALEAGADDYVTKPFAFEELLARVRARTRAAASPARAAVLEHDGLRVDVLARRVTVDGEEVRLTTRELIVLETLLEHPGEVLSRDELLAHAWGHIHDTGSNVVDVCIGRLRRKLGAHRFETIRGAGYRMAR
jgi:DNA-binding response OmpR family regulator